MEPVNPPKATTSTSSMRYFPIELDVLDRDALVIGGGSEAASKIDRLLAAGAKVTVITRGSGAHPIVEERAREGQITWLVRAPSLSDAEGKAIIFLEAEGDDADEALSRRLFEEASRVGLLVCTLDRPEVSTFANPSVARAPGLTMSFSSGGVSPSVVRRVREDLEALFSDPLFARFMDRLKALRSSLPRGERSRVMKEAVAGFALEARLHFPRWLTAKDPK